MHVFDDRRTRPASSVLACAALSWLGLVVHNVADLPDQNLWSAETAYPTLALLLILALWAANRSVGTWVLAAWALLHLVGGAVLSVLPLPVLPYAPEQSVRHYTFHVLYGLAQVPLLVACARELRRSRDERPDDDAGDPRRVPSRSATTRHITARRR